MNSKIYAKFTKLPIRHKLIVYTKLVHGQAFKPQNNDLFGLNRRLVSNIFRSFIDSLKEEFNVKKDHKAKDKSSPKKGNSAKE